MSFSDILMLEEMVISRTGIVLQPGRSEIILSRIKRHLKDLGIKSISTYVNIINSSTAEEERFINIITNSTTDFFRGNEQFEYLKKNYLPVFFGKHNKIRIWSAACSTGEEPYTIAILLYEVLMDLNKYDIKILATDINTLSLKIAKGGIYARSKILNLSPERQMVNFKIYDVKNDEVIIKDHLKGLIRFSQLNLIESWPMHGPFNIIFIRNTLMFMQKDVRVMIQKKMDSLLEIGGLLILGYSEKFDLQEQYQPVGDSIYKKLF